MVFLVHAAFIGHGIKYPVQPSIKLYSKDVNELDSFPISFKICVKELENPSERYKKVGYSTVWNFFKGLPDSSGSLVGWSGNNTGNTSRTSVEGTNGNGNVVLFTLVNSDVISELLSDVSFDWARIVRSIEITTKDSKKIKVNGKDVPWSLIPQ